MKVSAWSNGKRFSLSVYGIREGDCELFLCTGQEELLFDLVPDVLARGSGERKAAADKELFASTRQERY